MFAQDLRYAIRTLVKYRGFTAVAILTLAFALGANTAIFSVVNAILLQPLPYPNSERLVDMLTFDPAANNAFELSYANYNDIRTQAKSLQTATVYYRTGAFLERGGELQRVTGAAVSREVLDVLGVRPALGRGFTPAEDREGGAPVIVLSHQTWKNFFNGDRSIIGRSIRYGSGGRSRTVVGVLPEGVEFPIGGPSGFADFWIPIMQELDRSERENRGTVFMNAVGLLRPGATAEQLQAEVQTIARRIAQQDPAMVGTSFQTRMLQDVLVEPVRGPLLVLLAAVALVLLIGCANVANLLLARAAARQKEISIRTAIGATRARIVKQMLVESVVLSLLAGAVGLLLAFWGIDLLIALAPGDIPRLTAARIDLPVLGFTLALSLLTGIVFGLVPALGAGRTNLVDTLKEGSRGSTEGKSRNRVRSALIVAEVALSIVLLAGAGLMMRSFLSLSNLDAGYDPTDRAVVEVSARPTYDTPEKRARLFRNLVERIQALPGVQGVSGASVMPMSGAETVWAYRIVGQPEPPPNEVPNAIVVITLPDYFKTMGIRLLRGRDFTWQDNSPVLIVDELFAQRHFAGRDAIGQKVAFGTGEDRVERTIVGIAGQVRYWRLTDAPQPTFYFPASEGQAGRQGIIVKTKNAEAIGPQLRAAVRAVDPQQPIIRVTTLEEIRGDSLAARRFNLLLLGMLAALALTLAAVGIYSVMSYNVTQRTSEIGIRMALGAETNDIFKLVVGKAVQLVAIGLILGVGGAMAATRLLRSLLYGVTPADPATFSAICAVIAAVALLASYVPARRAARVDPLVAIRYD